MMKNMTYRLLAISAFVATSMTACDKNPYGPTNGHLINKEEGKEEVTEKPEEEGIFAKGADISWITQMEEDGVKFYDPDGKETECTELLKECGFNSIRLRVWVDPEGGWCGKEDVLVKAKRAQELGMSIMIDFHYSDSWADPSKQNPPAEWKEYESARMADAVAAHTRDVLSLLKENGVDVKWVQIGNEVNSGMLWPSGKVQGESASDFIRYINMGYCTVKDIYPSANVIIHLSNGHDSGLFEWFFSLMKTGNARYDMIGMSLYPSWWENGGWCGWKSNADKCIANIKSLNQMFGKPVMICEFGMPVGEADMSKDALQYLLDETKKIRNFQGIFLWEPQTDGIWKPASYTSLGWNAYDKGAFSNGRPTSALDPFKE